MGNQIYFKIAGQRSCCADHFSSMSDFSYYKRFLSYYPKPAILPYVLFSVSGHVGWCTASLDTI